MAQACAQGIRKQGTMGLRVDMDTALITVSVVASRTSRMAGHRERIISKKRSLGVELRFDT